MGRFSEMTKREAIKYCWDRNFPVAACFDVVVEILGFMVTMSDVERTYMELLTEMEEFASNAEVQNWKESL